MWWHNTASLGPPRQSPSPRARVFQIPPDHWPQSRSRLLWPTNLFFPCSQETEGSRKGAFSGEAVGIVEKSLTQLHRPGIHLARAREEPVQSTTPPARPHETNHPAILGNPLTTSSTLRSPRFRLYNTPLLDSHPLALARRSPQHHMCLTTAGRRIANPFDSQHGLCRGSELARGLARPLGSLPTSSGGCCEGGWMV